MKQL
jgi:hypothetical protein